MIRPRSALSLVVMATFLVGACSAATPSASQTTPGTPSSPPASATGTTTPTATAVTPLTSLVSPGKLIDCVDIEYPPMEYFPEGGAVTDPAKAIGFDIDAAKAIAASLGLQLEVRNAAFDAVIPDLAAGRCDIVMSALFVSEKRLAVADAVPYMATGHVIMVVTGNPKGIKSQTDLCGKPVSIQSGGVVETKINAASAECTAAGNPAIAIQGYPKVVDEFQQIALGRVDAVWEVDLGVADWQNRNPGKYEIAYALPRTDTFGVYFQKGKTDMKTALTAAFAALKADGTLTSIAKKYSIDPESLAPIK